MNKFDEVANDIMNEVCKVSCNTIEETMLKMELLMNLNHLLENEETYSMNLSVLQNSKNEYKISIRYNDEVFNRLTDEIIRLIAKLHYDDNEKLIIKTELLMNLDILFRNQTNYYNGMMALENNLLKGKSR